jgi:hypothetical protein
MTKPRRKVDNPPRRTGDELGGGGKSVMSLLTELFTLSLAPLRGVTWIAGRMFLGGGSKRDDLLRLQADLRELYCSYAKGRLAPEEFLSAEEQLLLRLEKAERLRQDRG